MVAEKEETKRLTWEEVFQRKEDFIGGEVEEEDVGCLYRGPIKAIERQPNGSYCVELHWCACLKPSAGEWEVGGVNKGFFSDRDNPPSKIDGGRIAYHRMMCGPGVIFPKGGSKLDPNKVKGLNLVST